MEVVQRLLYTMADTVGVWDGPMVVVLMGVLLIACHLAYGIYIDG